MPYVDYDAHAQVYRDAKGHDRTCLNCVRLLREENTRPSDAFFADSYRSEIGESYTGVEPRDRRNTVYDSELGGVCEECGATDSHTLVHSGETLSTGDLLERAEAVFATIEELYGVEIDVVHAKETVREWKSDPEKTNIPADEILELAIGFGAARAAYQSHDAGSVDAQAAVVAD